MLGKVGSVNDASLLKVAASQQSGTLPGGNSAGDLAPMQAWPGLRSLRDEPVNAASVWVWMVDGGW